MAFTFNKEALREDARRVARNLPEAKRMALEMAEEKFESAKIEMMNEFNSHAVTQELEGGPEGENVSSTLGGYGNLYSFIGFQEGYDPTAAIKGYLESKVELKRGARLVKGKSEDTYLFEVATPVIAEIEDLTPSPWEGKSWTRGIERGISGLGYYIYSKIKNFKNSRSGLGIQAEPKIRELAYKPVKYLSTIVNNFKQKFR